MKSIPRKFYKIIATFICLFIFTATTVSAEIDPRWGSPSPNITVPENNYNINWRVPMNDAATAWNGTPTSVTIGYLSSSPNQLLSNFYSDTWYGLSTCANPGPFTIKLNSRTIKADAANFSNFVTSVLVHEYGHIFCLDHTTNTSIMNPGRNRNTMTKPQQFDIDEVNSVYQ